MRFRAMLFSVFVSLSSSSYGVDNETAAYQLPRMQSGEFNLTVSGDNDTEGFSHEFEGNFAPEIPDPLDSSDVFSMFVPLYSRTGNERCTRHSKLFLQELKKFTRWATQMFDASTKFPHGILHGSTYDLGNFDECLQVEVGLEGKEEEGELLRGQYCLVTAHVQPLLASTANTTTWQWIQELSQEPSRRPRNQVHWAMCIPASCAPNDLTSHLGALLERYAARYGVRAAVSVAPNMCQTKTETSLVWADLAVMLVFGLFVMAVYSCTMYDLFTSLSGLEKYRLTGRPHTALEAFSAAANIRRLLTYSKSDDRLDCIHGLKVVSICLIIMGHRIMFVLGAPIVNTEFVEGFYSKVEAMILLNGPIVVDTFFNISGFLVCYLLLLEYKKNKSVNIPLLYLHRYIRLTPVYLAVVAFYCTLFVKIGSGPLWADKVGTEAARCGFSWWTNALYINNYVSIDNMCMIQSWYLSCDTHLFLVSPFIVSLLYHRPRVGSMFLAVLVLASVAISFSVTYFKKLDALLLLYMKTLSDPIANQTFRDIYIPTHTRASPYFIGMAAGFIRYKLKYSTFKIPKLWVWAGWAAAILLVESTVFSAWLFYAPGLTHDQLVTASYGAFHRVTWATGTSWMIIAMSTGNGAFIEPLFSWKPVITLSRLCYCAFLCHGGLQLYSVASARTPYYGSLYNLVWYSLGDVTLSFFLALALTLLFESPILGLERILRKKESVDSNEEVSSNKESQSQARECFRTNIDVSYVKSNFTSVKL